MRTSRICVAVSVLFVLVAGLAATASAVPVFARKYGFSCTMCHSNAPRLNDFGTRYRANGYRLPGREKDEKTVLESPAPVAFRTSAGYTYESFSNVPDSLGLAETSGFRMSGLDLLSAGLLGEKIGYMMIYTPQVEESRYVEGQTGALEMANVVFSGVGSPALNVRAGRFEPAYAAFSVKRRLSVSPYDIYDYRRTGRRRVLRDPDRYRGHRSRTRVELRGGLARRIGNEPAGRRPGRRLRARRGGDRTRGGSNGRTEDRRDGVLRVGEAGSSY